ncbi:MAG: hypothetical protein Q9184_006310 [Pyrenodesmia sp. 2 TL-2023]
MLQGDRWAIILIYEAFNARDQDELDKELESVSALRDGQEGSGPLPAGDGVTTKPTFKPQKRLRYALAKALPQVESSTPRYLVTDVPGYVKHVLGGQGAEIDRLNAWWASATSAFAGAVGYYDDNDMEACLGRIYSDEGFGLTSRVSHGTGSVEEAMKNVTIS